MLKVAAKKEAVKLPCSLHFSHRSTVMSGYLLSTVYTIEYNKFQGTALCNLTLYSIYNAESSKNFYRSSEIMRI